MIRTGGAVDAARCEVLVGALADTGVPPGELAALAAVLATEQHNATARIGETLARSRVRL